MQVEQRLPSSLYHAHPHSGDQNQVHVNGIQSNSKSQHSPSTNGHTNGDTMHPYHQQQYGSGHGAPQQQRQYPHTQLPPMYPSMSMPPPAPNLGGPNSGAPPAMYTPAPQLPPPPMQQNNVQQQEKQMSMSLNNGKYKFELRVEQQPQRARMCGFGDKDRRPITPPPCVRLVITDMHTGQPVNIDQIDGSYFILQVDLWDDSASREVNIVRCSSASPAVSISTATTTSYPPTPDRPMMQEYPPMMYQGPDGQPIYPPPNVRPMQYSSMSYYPQAYPGGPGGGGSYPPPMTGGSQQQNTSMFTRNLIGSLTVNASVLKDPNGNFGFWFVLQDLSVRTEGFFRYVTLPYNILSSPC